MDIIGGIGTLLLLAVFFRKVWSPKKVWRYEGEAAAVKYAHADRLTFGRILLAWSPFLLLAGFVVLWGLAPVSKTLDKVSWKQPVPGLHMQVVRTPPVVAKPYAEPALFDVSWLSTPGTGTFLRRPDRGSAGGAVVQENHPDLFPVDVAVAPQPGGDSGDARARLHHALSAAWTPPWGWRWRTRARLFPFFGTMIGWLGVALSGTDAGSNALFGSLQVITANKLGLSPILMGAANSAGGVMGKMIAAQSLVIGCAVTGQEGQEGPLFQAVLKHSIGLLLLVGLIVMMYAYVFPAAIPSGHKFW